MEDPVKKALDELLKITNELDKLRQPGAPTHDYTEEEKETLYNLLKQEKEAKKKYYALLFQKLQWPKDEIDTWLKQSGLLP